VVVTSLPSLVAQTVQALGSQGGQGSGGSSTTPTATPTGGGQGAVPRTPGSQLGDAGAPTSYTGVSGEPSPDPAPGNGTDGSGTGPIDWHAYLADWGFPPEVVDQLDKIFKTYTDPTQARDAALAYLRGTDWYKQTFPGISNGIKLGLISDEASYRAYVNQVNQMYKSYYGRDVTSAEIANYLNSGLDITRIGNHLQGQALVAANGQDWQTLLGAFDNQGRASDSDLSQYGDFLGGIGNMVGPQLQARLQKAQQRFNRVFQGQLATPSLSVLQGGGLATTRPSDQPDVAA
jgi:hypothetical protein